MNYQKSDLIYEGKGKKVYSIVGEKNYLWLEYKDSLTAFNAQKKGSFANKGFVNRQIASLVFRFLKKSKIKSHWVADLGAHDMVCEKLAMIPLEVVVRNVVAGSFAKKFGLEEGAKLKKPVVEFFYKKDELNDPFINDEQALFLNAVKNQKELEELKKSALTVNAALIKFFSKIGIQLVDFKLEYGRNKKGQICLGDEITPDSCRLWDSKTGRKLDKDIFRRDLGNVGEGYQEVLLRAKNYWGGKL